MEVLRVKVGPTRRHPRRASHHPWSGEHILARETAFALGAFALMAAGVTLVALVKSWGWF